MLVYPIVNNKTIVCKTGLMPSTIGELAINAVMFIPYIFKSVIYVYCFQILFLHRANQNSHQSR